MRRFYPLFICVAIFMACKEKVVKVEKSSVSLPEVTVPKEDFIPEGWTELTEEDGFVLDIRYATPNNFTGEVLYPCQRCFLRNEVAESLKTAQRFIFQKYNLRFKLYDCYRPKSIQEKLWAITPNASYVTPPAKGSMHNRGMALDLSIVDSLNFEWDMGTTYDYFGREAHIDFMGLSEEILEKRSFLQTIMKKYGFVGIRTEWWHFSHPENVKEIDDWVWSCDALTQKM